MLISTISCDSLDDVKRNEPAKTATLQISPTLHARAKQVADALGMKLYAFVEAAITHHIEALPKNGKRQ